MRKNLPLFALLLAAGCRGTAPTYWGSAEPGLSAIIVGTRILTPTGETSEGSLAINLESEGGERYRIDLNPGETALLRVEPGLYRIYPTRNLFGFVQSQLRVRVVDTVYRVPFPRDILRMDPIEIKPKKIVALGVLEARLLPVAKGETRVIEVRLDKENTTRRKLVENLINKMMDSKAAAAIRESSISWMRALEQALIRIQGEEQHSIIYKPSQ